MAPCSSGSTTFNQTHLSSFIVWKVELFYLPAHVFREWNHKWSLRLFIVLDSQKVVEKRLQGTNGRFSYCWIGFIHKCGEEGGMPDLMGLFLLK